MNERDGLPYPHHIAYSISALVRRCIEGLASPYLRELCCPTTQVQRRCCLRSAMQAELIVSRARTATRQRRAFSVAGPATRNGRPVTLRKISVHHSIFFISVLKTVMFDRACNYWFGGSFTML